MADIAICVGVGLMAIDMFTSKRGKAPVLRAPPVPAQSGESIPDPYPWYPDATAPHEPSEAPAPEGPAIGAAAPPPGAEPPAPEANR